MVALKEQQYAELETQNDQTQTIELILANNEALSVADPAVPPFTPSSPSKLLELAIGLIVALFGGAIVVFLVDNLDTRVSTTNQLVKVTGILFLI